MSNELIDEKSPIKPGDTLIWISSLDNAKGYRKDVVIEKVGRKWATIVDSWNGWKVDINTLKVEGNRGYGYCFRSEEELSAAVDAFYQEKAAHAAWEKLQRKVRDSWRKPDHLTEEVILQAMKILGWSEQ